ncbi:MAG: hypothetical protein LBH74_00330 [Nitrososphaerota archaeon]|jgi:ribosome-dependent ATPase|uniref:hypothetical protein n=1 Tax=Candidatus Bathycorpusculum sp. TaxID=2994959 RepID=UPI00282B1DC8|nr:hypothetical protein [Candidatus Termitimicrobium sp.]MDR0492078.1 hypothetical protein [Nitrososphaerota archaeon]
MFSKVLIEASGLTKKFGEFVAVDHIDFEVYRGECVGFLGAKRCGQNHDCIRYYEMVIFAF